MKHESAPKFKHGKENGKNYCHKFINSTVQEMIKKKRKQLLHFTEHAFRSLWIISLFVKLHSFVC